MIIIKNGKKQTFGENTLKTLIESSKKDINEIFREFDTTLEGLDEEDAQDRLELYGLNEPAHEKPRPWYVQLFDAFITPFNGILIFLAFVSYVTDVALLSPHERNWSTVIIILVMVISSGLIRFFQEYRSNKEAQKLKAMIKTTVAVKRKGSDVREIDIKQIVPGDIVYLGAGDMIPADVRIIFSKDLFVNQSTLTGESEPVEKYPDLKPEKSNSANLSIVDLDNICFMGTSVVSGRATAVVVQTGEKTYFGMVAKSIIGKKAKTSFEQGVDQVSRLLITFMISMFPVVLIVNGFVKGNWLEALLFSLAVAVGLTPEMLPMIVTTNLAKGAVTMAKQKAVVKRLDSIQNFGAMDILCTDKTGTLTLNKIILVKHINIDGEEDERILRHAFLNSYYQTGLRNLLDVAILEYAAENGMNVSELEKQYRKVDEIPFDFVRRRMSVVLESENGNGKKRQLVTKGAVEEVLQICDYAEYGNQVVPLTDAIKQTISDMVRDLNEDGMRVLAVAQKNNVPPANVFGVADESNMVLMGFLAFLDPPKESALQAVKALKENGIEIKILTGDNEVVTKKVCKEVGIPVKNTIVGNDVEKLSDEELYKIAQQTTVFAKLTPLQKARIIRALKGNGHVVGFLGDGINDAPAMKEADVAISVDNAADIARESADIILLERSLMVLEQGVIEGRKIFGNIMKYIATTSSSNFGNVFSVLIASAFLPFLPMTPLQLLFLNLIYDITMMLIPWDRMDKEFTQRPRKWEAKNLGHFMIWFGPVSSIFDISTYLLMFYIVGPMVLKGSYFSLSPTAQAAFVTLFQTGWFVESLWTQTMVVHTLRTEKIPFVQSRPSTPLFLATLFTVICGMIVPYTIAGRILGMAQLPLIYFIIVLIPTVLAYLSLAQLVKKFFIRKFGSLL